MVDAPAAAAGAGPAPPDTEPREVSAAARAAAEAAADWAGADGPRRAGALRAIADELDEAVVELVSAADAETALGEARLSGEVARTTGQLRMLAEIVERGGELEPIISEADPDAARPDVRRMLRAIGPVAVFSASMGYPFTSGSAGTVRWCRQRAATIRAPTRSSWPGFPTSPGSERLSGHV
ncbi:MAG TPA: aldehyde dehydrogenase family protein, partial [Solirubrobacteraceae bacterium]|nr:aldehyde dehydrogenase family protein [Solirubrobacteraceae bacterium]